MNEKLSRPQFNQMDTTEILTKMLMLTRKKPTIRAPLPGLCSSPK